MGGDVAARRNSTRTPAIDSLVDSRARRHRQRDVHRILVDGVGAEERGTRLVQVHAVSAGYPFYGNIVTDPVAAWGQIQNGALPSSIPLLVSLDAQLGDTLALGSAKFVITGSLRSVPGDVGISAAIGPRVYIPSGSFRRQASSFRQPRRVRDAVQASDDTHERRVRQGLRQASRGGQRLGAERGLQRVTARRRDRPVARLSRHRRADRAPPRRHRRGERRARVRHAEDRPGGDPPLRGRDELAGARHLHDAGGGDGSRRRGSGRRVGTRHPVRDAVRAARFPPGRRGPPPRAASDPSWLAIGVWVALLFAMRPLVALRRVSPLQALRREPDADARCAARWDPLRIAVSGDRGSVLALRLSRANTPRRGVGFTWPSRAHRHPVLSAAGLSWAARRLIRPSWPFRCARGSRASTDRESNARRRARARIRRVPHGNAVPGSIQHSSIARPAPRRSAPMSSSSSTFRRISKPESIRSSTRRARS